MKRKQQHITLFDVMAVAIMLGVFSLHAVYIAEVVTLNEARQFWVVLAAILALAIMLRVFRSRKNMLGGE